MPRYAAGELASKSGFRGVYLDRGTGDWVARITDDGMRVRLGRFATPEEAARCVDEENIRLRGKDALLNFS